MDEKHIPSMNYSEFVGLVDERNRPSGGIKTIQAVIINARISEKSKILEIGSNTGFTSVNINLLTNAEVLGIDVNLPSVEKAKSYAKDMGTEKVQFVHSDATHLPFADNSFDVVWCSNVTSFIDDKDKAIKEYLRVLKPLGTLAVVPIYYRKVPPEHIVKKVSDAIGCKIGVWDKQYWMNLFKQVGSKNKVALEVYYSEDFKYLDQSHRIAGYVDMLVKNATERGLIKKETAGHVKKCATHYYSLFNENNHKYAGYSVILMQKRTAVEEEELFLSEKV